MACGTPLISTDSGGLKDVIGDSAIRIKSGSSEDIEEHYDDWAQYYIDQTELKIFNRR